MALPAETPTAEQLAITARMREIAMLPRKPDLAQVIAMQTALYETCMVLKEDIHTVSDKEERARIASAIASVAKGWQGLQDSKRIIRGKPLPGSKRPAVEQPKHKVKASPSFTEEP